MRAASFFGGSKKPVSRQAFAGGQGGGRRGQAGRRRGPPGRGGRGGSRGGQGGHWFDGKWYPSSAGQAGRGRGGGGGQRGRGGYGEGYGRQPFDDGFSDGMSGYARRIGHRL